MMANFEVDSSPSATPDDRGNYARLPVRIRSVMYDSIIFVIAILVTISIATAMETDAAARVIGTIGALLILLYEPAMVSAKGSTVGHMACNLRIVDDRTLGNPSIVKSTARFAIKLVLGWLSFVTIMASKRQRAIHDVLTDTTVQSRNTSRVKDYDFAKATSEPTDRKIYSGPWRVFSILIYSLLSFATLLLGSSLLQGLGLISAGCIELERCSAVENLLTGVLGLGWLASLFVVVGLGWRGRLYGFRAR